MLLNVSMGIGGRGNKVLVDPQRKGDCTAQGGERDGRDRLGKGGERILSAKHGKGLSLR